MTNRNHRPTSRGNADARFRDHDPAKDLARRALVLRNGQLVGRYSGRPVTELFGYHGRVEDDERRVFLDMLAWQVATGGTETKADQ